MRELNELCDARGVKVSTGGFLEYVLTQGEEAVDRYLGKCRELGFDMVEVSSGFVSLAAEDLIGLTKRVIANDPERSRRSASSSGRAVRAP